MNGPGDYSLISIPMSCCTKTEGFLQSALDTCINPYPKGCVSVFSDYLKFSGKTAGGVVIGIAVVEVSKFYFWTNIFYLRSYFMCVQ